ncbi:unnamed protein product [Schistosoma turkestanicum]|nr:unnamed protein product [Schistosoma turkestanicum]
MSINYHVHQNNLSKHNRTLGNYTNNVILSKIISIVGMMLQLFKLNIIIIVILSAILNTLKVESSTFFAPINFDEQGNMYVKINEESFSIDGNYMLTINSGNCIKTISLTPPTKEEIASKSGYREVTNLCIP